MTTQLLRGSRSAAIFCLFAGMCAKAAWSQDQDLSKKKNSDQSQVQQESAKNAQTPAPSAGQDAQQDEITAVPNRPTFASTAETVQRGVFEVEYGFELADAHQNINGLLKWGMFKNLELWFLNIPIERDSAVAGRGDSGAGFKYRMFSQSKILPSTAILYVATLPTATANLGAGGLGHSIQFLFSKDFGKHHFDLNEGVEFVARQAATGFDRNYFTALSYSHPISGKWGWTGELAGYSWTNASNPAKMILLGAGTYNMSSRLVLDGGAYVGIYGNLPRVTFFSGVTYSVADLYHLHSLRSQAKH
ncbi:MAG: transporter [Candidatus Acidiferrum sp.]